jgi:hypothetical protein
MDLAKNICWVDLYTVKVTEIRNMATLEHRGIIK